MLSPTTTEASNGTPRRPVGRQEQIGVGFGIRTRSRVNTGKSEGVRSISRAERAVSSRPLVAIACGTPAAARTCSNSIWHRGVGGLASPDVVRLGVQLCSRSASPLLGFHRFPLQGIHEQSAAHADAAMNAPNGKFHSGSPALRARRARAGTHYRPGAIQIEQECLGRDSNGKLAMFLDLPAEAAIQSTAASPTGSPTKVLTGILLRPTILREA